MQTASSSAPPSLASARHPALARFILDHAIVRGSFTLASGLTSTYYCDGKQVSFAPEGALLLADAILDEITRLEGPVHAVGGMDMGATPIVSVVAARSFLRGTPLPSFIVRKDVKSHGTMKLIEGVLPPRPSRLVMVEDVVTTGTSILKAVNVVRAAGHEVALTIAMLDRAAGGEANLRAHHVPYQPLVTIGELGLATDTTPASH